MQKPILFNSLNMQSKKEEMFEASTRLRGLVLDATIDIERAIDNYLSNYFCATSNKKNELNELLFFTEKVTLESKRQIFCAIVETHNQAFLNKHPDFLSSIERIVPHRNIFAHLELDDSELAISSSDIELVFKKYAKGKLTSKKYDIEQLKNLREDIARVKLCLHELVLTLPSLI